MTSERRGPDQARTWVTLFGLAVTLVGGGVSVGVIIQKLDAVTAIVPVVQDINIRLTRVEERTIMDGRRKDAATNNNQP